jgi:thiazole synthase
VSEDVLKIGQFEFRSRLFTGTGKYPNLDTAKKALEASGCEVVTVAVRRVDLKATGADSIMTVLREGKYTLLPNTAGCYTAEDAVRMLQLRRSQ